MGMMHLSETTIALLCIISTSSATLFNDDIYPQMEIPDSYFIDEAYPFRDDFEDEGTDEENGWTVVNEGEISQLLDTIEEAEQKEDEKERMNQDLRRGEEGISTERLTVETVEEPGETEKTDFLAPQPLARSEKTEEEAAVEDAIKSLSEARTPGATTTTPFSDVEEETTPMFEGEETTMDPDLDPLTSDS